MFIPRLAPSSKGNLHEMAKLYVTRVTSRRSSPMRCPLSANSGHQPHICSNENRKTASQRSLRKFHHAY